MPFIFPLFVTALIFFISGIAESGRSPFDLVEAESEIVAGYHIEYSGMKFSLFFLGEFVHAFAVCAVITTVFLNGWARADFAAVDLVLHQVVCGVLHHDVDQVHHAALPHRSADGLQLEVPGAVVAGESAASWRCSIPCCGRWALARETNPWVWGMILFAANLVMLFIALWALGRAARKSRRSERRIVARMDDVKPAQAPVAASSN